MDRGNLSPLRSLAKLLLGSLISDKVNWNNITKRQLLKYIFDPPFRRELNNTTPNHKTHITLEGIVLRNLSLWSAISNGLGVKVYYFLEPFLRLGERSIKGRTENN